MIMQTEHQCRIEEFMKLMKQEKQFVPDKPIIPNREIRELRARLILEEALETIRGLGFITVPIENEDPKPNEPEFQFIETDAGCDIVEVADGCIDISVVTIGTLSAFGIKDIPLLREVDEANLNKFGLGSYARKDGKWMKPKNWIAPNIIGRLIEQGYKEGK